MTPYAIIGPLGIVLINTITIIIIIIIIIIIAKIHLYL